MDFEIHWDDIWEQTKATVMAASASSNPFQATTNPPAGGVGVGTGALQSPYPRRRELIDMIRDRWDMANRAMHGWDETYHALCPAICVHSPGNGTVYVFCGHNKGAEIIEDEAVIFPSDALLAKLRLLVNACK